MVKLVTLMLSSERVFSCSTVFISNSLQIFLRVSMSSLFLAMPSLFLLKRMELFVRKLTAFCGSYLLVDAHQLGHEFGVKLRQLALELAKMFNDPFKDSLETVSAELQCEHSFQVEWTLPLSDKLGLTNLGCLL